MSCKQLAWRLAKKNEELARMLAQTAVALACDDLPETYGVLTPGGVMGDALLRRLPRVGIRFEIRD